VRGHPRVIVSCEHGGNRIPAAYRAAFKGADKALASHRGWDPGALEVGRRLAKALDAPFFGATVSRLLVDLNRSPGHPKRFSEFSRGFDRSTRDAIVAAYYAPHRAAVQAAIESALKRGPVLHLCVHSFTPVMDGVERETDVGLLYDPKRPGERALCRMWRDMAMQAHPDIRVRLNYPYHGASDGFTTALRRMWPAPRYLGVELEMNQKFVHAVGARWRRYRAGVENGFLTALRAFAAKKF
jgi:predicted N-formylglutamate amidohydrolase